jgi:hypothetical protein
VKIKKALVLGAFFLFGNAVFAQDSLPKLEVSLDFSYVRWNPSKDVANAVDLFGGGGAAAYYLKSWVGVKAEFEGYGSTSQAFQIPGSTTRVSANGNLLTYMFGPVLKKRSGAFQPFAEALVGGAHSNVYANVVNNGAVGVSPSGNALAFAGGGGLDLKVLPSIALRVAELDYLLTRFTGFNAGSSHSSQINFRYQGGVVINF